MAATKARCTPRVALLFASTLAFASVVLYVVFISAFASECSRRPRAIVRGLCADHQPDASDPVLADAVVASMALAAPSDGIKALSDGDGETSEAPSEGDGETSDAPDSDSMRVAMIGGCVVYVILSLSNSFKRAARPLQGPGPDKTAAASLDAGPLSASVVDDNIMRELHAELNKLRTTMETVVGTASLKMLDGVARANIHSRASIDALTAQVRALAEVIGSVQERETGNRALIDRAVSGAGQKMDAMTSSFDGNMRELHAELKNLAQTHETLVETAVAKMLEVDAGVACAKRDAAAAIDQVKNVAMTIMNCL